MIIYPCKDKSAKKIMLADAEEVEGVRIYEAFVQVQDILYKMDDATPETRHEINQYIANKLGFTDEELTLEASEKKHRAFKKLHEYAREHSPNQLMSAGSMYQILQGIVQMGKIAQDVAEGKLEPRSTGITIRKAFLVILGNLLQVLGICFLGLALAKFICK